MTAREVVTQCTCGQLPELEPVQRGCEACGADPGERCRPMCIGEAAHQDETGEAWCNHDAPGVVDGVCECGEVMCTCGKPRVQCRAEQRLAQYEAGAAPQ